MKLLVVTQAVDQRDLALGFFHRWLEVLSGRFERLEVVCLKEGAYSLPNTVSVRSLGKPARRLIYVGNFYRYLFALDYDTVFVHMNEEYVLLGGILWRLMGKKVVLWRNHKMGSWRTRLAVRLASVVCYTSPEAFVAYSKKAVRMPIGIDTDFFVPAGAPAQNSVLFLGRLDPVKKVKEFIEALALLTVPVEVGIYGSPTDPNSAYAKELADKAAIHPGVPYAQTRELYQRHAIYVNLTPSGSFDKTIGEAMASGCVVVCVNEALRGVVPEALLSSGSAESTAAALRHALSMSALEREALQQKLRSYVEHEHSLHLLAQKLEAIIKT